GGRGGGRGRGARRGSGTRPRPPSAPGGRPAGAPRPPPPGRGTRAGRPRGPPPGPPRARGRPAPATGAARPPAPTAPTPPGTGREWAPGVGPRVARRRSGERVAAEPGRPSVFLLAGAGRERGVRQERPAGEEAVEDGGEQHGGSVPERGLVEFDCELLARVAVHRRAPLDAHPADPREHPQQGVVAAVEPG